MPITSGTFSVYQYKLIKKKPLVKSESERKNFLKSIIPYFNKTNANKFESIYKTLVPKVIKFNIDLN